jgi:hypothetical protein
LAAVADNFSPNKLASIADADVPAGPEFFAQADLGVKHRGKYLS